jgi:hypothetical protein
MPQIVIENPVLNSPFEEPQRHFKFNDEGITDEIVAGRRRSSYFVPIARPRKKGAQPSLYGDWTQDRLEETKLVNDIRQSVARWRQGGYVDITTTSRRLLDYWTDPDREQALLFLPDRGAGDGHLPDRGSAQVRPVDRQHAARGQRGRQPRSASASPSRWRPAPARPWSWPCSLPGRR